MKKFLYLILGVVIGTLLGTSFSSAQTPIKLVVNGMQIQSDVPPQIINGRTMIPAKFLAEALGADVKWDEVNSSVIVTSKLSSEPQKEDSPGITLDNFYKIKTGMTIQQVTALLGSQGKLVDTFNGSTIQSSTYEWSTGNFAKITVDFQRGVVASMYQIGLR
jgi:hypothetical protein